MKGKIVFETVHGSKDKLDFLQEFPILRFEQIHIRD